MAVEHGPGDAGVLGDRAQRGLLIAMFGEFAAGRRDDQGAALRGRQTAFGSLTLRRLQRPCDRSVLCRTDTPVCYDHFQNRRDDGIHPDRRAAGTSSKRSATSPSASAAPASSATRSPTTAPTPTTQELYKRIADLGWLGVAIPEAVRRHRRQRRRHVPAARGVRPRADPDGRSSSSA